MSEFAYPLGGKQDYTAAQAGAFHGTRTSGVWSGEDNLKVTVTGARQLTLSKGIAWITTEEYWGKVYVNTADINFTLPVADAVLDRICRIIIRWNKTTNTAAAMMLQGTPASSPTAPARSTTDELYDLVLCDYLVVHGEVTASAANLTDQRLNEDLCGLMRDGVTRIPTATLEAQVTALLSSIQEELAQMEAGAAVELKKLTASNYTAGSSYWETDPDNTYADFPYRTRLYMSGVTETMIPEVIFDVPEAMSGNFAPVAKTFLGGVYIYAAEAPSADITIPTIICWR